MKFFNVHGNEVQKPEHVTVEHRLSVYGATFLRGMKKMLFIRGAMSGLLECPGGKLELGESFSECLEREGKEETGHRLKLCGHLPISVHGPNGFCLPQWDRFYWSVGIVFIATASLQPDEDFEIDPIEATEVVILKKEDLDFGDIHPLFHDAVIKAVSKYR